MASPEHEQSSTRYRASFHAHTLTDACPCCLCFQRNKEIPHYPLLVSLSKDLLWAIYKEHDHFPEYLSSAQIRSVKDCHKKQQKSSSDKGRGPGQFSNAKKYIGVLINKRVIEVLEGRVLKVHE